MKLQLELDQLVVNQLWVMFQVTILSDLEASKSIIINKRQLREFIQHHHYHYIDRLLCRAMFFFIITKVENPKQKNPKRNWHA